MTFFFIVKSFLFVAIWISGFSAILPQELMECGTSTTPHTYECKGGFWPMRNEIAPNVLSQLINLVISDVTLRADYHILPLIETLKKVTLRRIVVLGRDGKPAVFPFFNFMQNVTKELVETVQLEDVRMGAITGVEFEGFSCLQVLHLTGCQIPTFDPGSFHYLYRLDDDDVLQTAFRELRVSNDDALVSFPWESLSSFSGTLQVIRFTSVRNMERITVASDAHIVGMSLKVLTLLDITGTKMTTLSKQVMKTISDPVIGKTNAARLVFASNANRCENKDLTRLIEWAQEQASTRRELKVSCIENSSGKTRTMEGDQAYWISHSSGHKTTTSDPSTTASSSVSRTPLMLLSTWLTLIAFIYTQTSNR